MMDLHGFHDPVSHNAVSGMNRSYEVIDDRTQDFSPFVHQPLPGVPVSSLSIAELQMSPTWHCAAVNTTTEDFDPLLDDLHRDTRSSSSQIIATASHWTFDSNTDMPSSVNAHLIVNDYDCFFGNTDAVQDWTPVTPQYLPPSTSTLSSMTPFTNSRSLPVNSSNILGQAPSCSTFTQMQHADPMTLIGSVHYHEESGNFMFKCRDLHCSHRTYSRWFDLRRHYEGTHAMIVPAHWCQMQGCERSEMEGGRSFPRKDKLADHVRKVHRPEAVNHVNAE